MKVRKGKKILKNTLDCLHTSERLYKSMVWDKQRKTFRVLTLWGQILLITF